MCNACYALRIRHIGDYVVGKRKWTEKQWLRKGNLFYETFRTSVEATTISCQHRNCKNALRFAYLGHSTNAWEPACRNTCQTAPYNNEMHQQAVNHSW